MLCVCVFIAGREQILPTISELLSPGASSEEAEDGAGWRESVRQVAIEGIEAEFDNDYGESFNFTCSFGSSRPPREVALLPGGAARKLRYQTRHEYVRLFKAAHMHKYDSQIKAIRRGLLCYLPGALLPLWNGYDLELAVAGEADVAADKLKATARIELGGSQKDWFWKCVEEMTAQQRSKLLRFATGRSRLPSEFAVGSSSGGDAAMPTAATCSMKMYMPTYSSQQVMMRQLLVAIETEDFGTG